MASLYRVLPYLPRARAGAPGHPLHVPRSAGSARVDNPELYDVLYVSDNPARAVAEAFGWAPRWGPGLLRGRPDLTGSVHALARYEPARAVRLCDLDDAARLVELELRPSRVVTRDRAVTQAWARRIHAEGRWSGVRWWSYYDPDWGSAGLWDLRGVRVAEVTPLTVQHPAFVAAADALVRVVDGQ